MYLTIIIISLVLLIAVDWRIGLLVAIIVICLDRVMDIYRRELEGKIKK